MFSFTEEVLLHSSQPSLGGVAAKKRQPFALSDVPETGTWSITLNCGKFDLTDSGYRGILFPISYAADLRIAFEMNLKQAYNPTNPKQRRFPTPSVGGCLLG
jgi:hypothetical protein